MEARGCRALADQTETHPCSTCGTMGQPVEAQTVKALLTEAALRRFEPGAYRFCPDSTCSVVYFGASVFRTDDVHVRVWQKEPAGARMICYCFDENEADIRAEVEQTGASKAVERVRDHIEAGRCACEIRNPKGACCLGDVIQAVKRIAEYG
jgi:Zinc binding domain